MTTLPKSAWDQGVTISEAIETYSNDELWGQFETLHEKLFPEIPADLPQEPIDWNPQPLLEASPTVEFPKYLEIRERLKAEIIALLRNGTLLGIGFLRPKYRGSEPMWISADCWIADARISWENSELWVHGKIFAEIRVVRPHDRVSISDSSATQAVRLAPIPGPNRAGRPTRANEIKAAYDELKLEGRINFSSLRANLGDIQSHVQKRAGADSKLLTGLQYNAVRKAIGAEFQKDKAERVSSKSSP